MSIAENVARVRAQIAEAAIAAGRRPEEITLCAATKMNASEAVREAIAAGVDCCGENRVQELTQKLSEDAYRGAPVHFIGRLQTNKVRQVVGRVDLIQSVDRVRLLEAIEAEAARQEIRQDVLLEINIGAQESKGGFFVQELDEILDKICGYSHIQVLGLMAIPPICEKPGDNDKFFLEMHNLSVDITRKKYDNIDMRILSMGMSGDYESAISCGSTMIRVGTAIFGPRDYAASHQK